MKRKLTLTIALTFGVSVLFSAARANEFEVCNDRIDAYAAELEAEHARLVAARGNPKARCEVALSFLLALEGMDTRLGSNCASLVRLLGGTKDADEAQWRQRVRECREKGLL